MKKVKITVVRMARYDDLMEQYENPIVHACTMALGQEFICNGAAARGHVRKRMGDAFPLRDGTGSWSGESVRRLDEGPEVGHDLLQRRLPAGELSD